MASSQSGRLSARMSSILALLLCHAAAGGVAHAATFTVTSASDSGAGTLRAAVGQANVAAGRDTIVFSQALIEAAASIDLDAAIGPIAVTESVDILAPGYAAITIDASGLQRALSANPSVSMRLTGLRITGAEDVGVRLEENSILRVSDSEFTANRVALEGGRVDIRNSRFTHNAAAVQAVRLDLRNSSVVDNGTAHYVRPDPSPIFVNPGPIVSAYYATIRNALFSGNEFTGAFIDDGTVVHVEDGIVSGSRFVGNPEQVLRLDSGTVRRSTFFGGRAQAGGAIDAGILQVLDSYFEDNVASGGGAIRASGSAFVVNSTFVRNRSTASDGFPGTESGGAIAAAWDLRIVNSSFSRNESLLGGSAVHARGDLLVRNSVFELNSAGGGTGREIEAEAEGVDLPGSSHNVFSDPASPLFIDGVNDNRVVAPPSLGPRAVHDDLPPFLPPLATGLLVDNGTTQDLAHYGIVQDARGRNRVSGPGVDIGAVETDGAVVGFFNQSFESGGFRPGGSCETLTPGIGRMTAVTVQGAPVSGLASMFGAWPPAPGTFVDLRLAKDRFVSIPLDAAAGTAFALELGPVPGPPSQQPSGAVAVAADCVGAPGTLHAVPTFETYDTCSLSNGTLAFFNQEGVNSYPRVYCDLEGIRAPVLNLAPNISAGNDCPPGGCMVRITAR